MTREVYRLMLMIIAGFALLIFSTAFWSIFENRSLMQREDNPRRVLAELNVQRGAIYSRNGVRLAYSQLNEPGMERIYPYPGVVSAIGHYSYQYGAAGVEAGQEALLSGQGLRNAWQIARDDLFNRRGKGADIRTTIDLEVQLALFDMMQWHPSGAAVVVHVPSGEVLAMVSKPYYDPNAIPNVLDATWEARLESRKNLLPLNNVVVAGYQPGGILQTLILSEMLAAGSTPDTWVSAVDVVLTDPALRLECPLYAETVTLAEAYRIGCSAPFVAAIENQISLDAFMDKLQAAGFLQTPSLFGYDLPAAPRPMVIDPAPDSLAAAAAGQGDLVISPLQVVEVVAALVNQGNGVPLHIVDAYRLPDSDEWQPFTLPTQSPAIMQPAVANTIRDMLQEFAWMFDDPLYGQRTYAYAGDREYSWFLGWSPLPEDGEYVVFVIVVQAGGNPAGPDAPEIAAHALEYLLRER